MTIPAITPYSGDLPLRSDPPSFPANAEDYVTWQEGTMVPEINATVDGMNATAAAMSVIAAGGAMTMAYTFSSTTTDADPGAGYLRLNNATQDNSTVIRLDLIGADGSTWTDAINAFDDSTSTVKGKIMLQKLSDPGAWLLFDMLSLASPSGYRNLTVSLVAASLANPFNDGDELILKFTANGDKGDIAVSHILTAANYTTNTGTSLDCDSVDMFIVTAQAGPLLFNNPSGTPTQGQAILIRIKDDGTARALTYGSQFRAIGVILPTTTVLSKTLYMGVVWNATDSKWDMVAVRQET